MAFYTFMLLLTGLIAAFLGLAAVAEIAVQIAMVLFVMEMAFELVLHLAAKYTR